MCRALAQIKDKKPKLISNFLEASPKHSTCRCHAMGLRPGIRLGFFKFMGNQMGLVVVCYTTGTCVYMGIALLSFGRYTNVL